MEYKSSWCTINYHYSNYNKALLTVYIALEVLFSYGKDIIRLSSVILQYLWEIVG